MVRWQRLLRNKVCKLIALAKTVCSLGTLWRCFCTQQEHMAKPRMQFIYNVGGLRSNKGKAEVLLQATPYYYRTSSHLCVSERQNWDKKRKSKVLQITNQWKNNNLPLLQVRAQFWRYILHVQGELISSWERWRRACFRKWKKLILRFLPILILYNWNCF